MTAILIITLTERGDFLEAYGNQARILAKALNLAVTKDRDTGKAMCGIPMHAADAWIKKLRENGIETTIQT